MPDMLWGNRVGRIVTEDPVHLSRAERLVAPLFPDPFGSVEEGEIPVLVPPHWTRDVDFQDFSSGS